MRWRRRRRMRLRRRRKRRMLFQTDPGADPAVAEQ